MTEEIIQAIREAEQQAAEIKTAATEKAALILSEGEKQAAQVEQAALDVCKAHRDSQLKQAVADADLAYQNSLAQKEKESKDYCARVLENSDAAVSKIVGRIIGGDR